MDTQLGLSTLEALKELALKGHAVLLSIHQASDSMWARFADDCSIMSKGKCVYSGPTSGLYPKLTSSLANKVESICLMIDQMGSSEEQRVKEPLWTIASGDKYAETPASRGLTTLAKEFWILLKRNFQSTLRTPYTWIARIFASVAVAVLLLLCHADLDDSGYALSFKKAGFFSVLSVYASILPIVVINVFLDRHRLVDREIRTNLYSAAIACFAMLFEEILVTCICGLLLSALPVFAGLSWHPAMVVTLIIILLHAVMSTLCLATAVLIPWPELALVAYCSQCAVSVSGSGMLSAPADLLAPLQQIQWISPIKYACIGMVQTEKGTTQWWNTDKDTWWNTTRCVLMLVLMLVLLTVSTILLFDRSYRRNSTYHKVEYWTTSSLTLQGKNGSVSEVHDADSDRKAELADAYGMCKQPSIAKWIFAIVVSVLLGLSGLLVDSWIWAVIVAIFGFMATVVASFGACTIHRIFYQPDACRGPCEEHLFDAIMLNIARKPYYVQATVGLSEKLSNALILVEMCSILPARYIDSKTQRLRDEGIPMGSTPYDFQPMYQVSRKEDPPKYYQQENLGGQRHESCNDLVERMLCDVLMAVDGDLMDLIECIATVLGRLNRLERDSSSHWQMTKHWLESFGIMALHAHAQIPTNENCADIWAKFRWIHKRLISPVICCVSPLCILIDTWAQECHSRHAGIIVNDVPYIPFLDEYAKYKSASSEQALISNNKPLPVSPLSEPTHTCVSRQRVASCGEQHLEDQEKQTPSNLHDNRTQVARFLRDSGMGAYHEQLTEVLGVTDMRDLAFLEKSDLDALQVSPIKQRRFAASLAKFGIEADACKFGQPGQH